MVGESHSGGDDDDHVSPDDDRFSRNTHIQIPKLTCTRKKGSYKGHRPLCAFMGFHLAFRRKMAREGEVRVQER